MATVKILAAKAGILIDLACLISPLALFCASLKLICLEQSSLLIYLWTRAKMSNEPTVDI
jgi:hypothetical protein